MGTLTVVTKMVGGILLSLAIGLSVGAVIAFNSDNLMATPFVTIATDNIQAETSRQVSKRVFIEVQYPAYPLDEGTQ